VFCSFEFKRAGVGGVGKGKVKRHPCIALETLDSFTLHIHSMVTPGGSGASRSGS
jgi:hypothetical protein